MRLRRFRPEGLARFSELVAAARETGVTALPPELLSSDALSEPAALAVEVEPEALGRSRLDAARYLEARLAPLSDAGRDRSLWAWLAAFYFDDVCPRDRRGRYRPGASAQYLPDLRDSRKSYRHRLLGPYLAYLAHKEKPERALCLLAQPILRPGRLVDRLATRPRLVACPAVVGAATRLYVDGRTGAIRRGAAASVDRLCDVLMQLDRTYDLYGMTEQALLGLLPKEFDAFRK